MNTVAAAATCGSRVFTGLPLTAGIMYDACWKPLASRAPVVMANVNRETRVILLCLRPRFDFHRVRVGFYYCEDCQEILDT
jgi:hypothetical protein